MSLSDAARRKIIREIEEGDVLVSGNPLGGEIIYFAVLEKNGVRATISLPSRSCESLIPARGLGGDIEISADGELLSADGDLTTLATLLIGVRKGAAKGLSKRFCSRIRPNDKLLRNQLEMEGDEQMKSTLFQICALVANKDYGESRAALHEMFFRVIKESRSSMESALYLGHFLRLVEDLAVNEARIELAKSLHHSLETPAPLGPQGEQEVNDLIQRVKG